MHKKTALKIGNIELDSSVVLAPMSGVTDKPFRKLVRKFGAGLVVSEMIASKEMLRAADKTQKTQTRYDDETPVAMQLAGTDPEIMAEAARLNQERGADIIDINMGCPVKKVVKTLAGSALMRDEDLAIRIMEAVKKAVDIPVTVKMRLGWDEYSLNAPRLAKAAQDIGLSAVTVHGRTREQMYTGCANWHAIRQVKETINIPLIANGDIVTFEDAQQILEQSGADGVMIGRGAYGRPWFINQVCQFLKTGTPPNDPDLATQMDLILEHYLDMLDHYGEHTGVRHARKHLSWYCKGLTGATEYRSQIMKISDPEQVIKTIKAFYTPLIDTKAAS